MKRPYQKHIYCQANSWLVKSPTILFIVMCKLVSNPAKRMTLLPWWKPHDRVWFRLKSNIAEEYSKATRKKSQNGAPPKGGDLLSSWSKTYLVMIVPSEKASVWKRNLSSGFASFDTGCNLASRWDFQKWRLQEESSGRTLPDLPKMDSWPVRK